MLPPLSRVLDQKSVGAWGKQGFERNGAATINSKQEWPDWYPPPEMIERRPDIEEQLVDLQSGRAFRSGRR